MDEKGEMNDAVASGRIGQRDDGVVCVIGENDVIERVG